MRGWVCLLQLLPAQSFSGPSPAGHMTIFYHLRFETRPTWKSQVPVFISHRNRLAQLYPQALGSLFVASYNAQGYSGGVRPHIHTGWQLSRFTKTLCLTWWWSPLSAADLLPYAIAVIYVHCWTLASHCVGHQSLIQIHYLMPWQSLVSAAELVPHSLVATGVHCRCVTSHHGGHECLLQALYPMPLQPPIYDTDPLHRGMWLLVSAANPYYCTMASTGVWCTFQLVPW
jgi:hypothetical protein